MKKILLALFLTVAGLAPVLAQDYAPFKMGRTPYFQAGDSIYSLRITTTYVQGADSVFEFNPRGVPVSNFTAVPGCINSSSNPNAVRSYNNLFGRKMLKNNSGEYRFVFTSPDTFLLKPYAAYGESWQFSPSITATMQSRSIENIQGLPDTVATVLLGNGSTIKIGRNFGLVSAKSFYSYLNLSSSSQNLELVRLPEAGIGEAVHPYSIYDFQVGDKFLFYGFQEGPLSLTCSEYWWTWEILGRFDCPSGDSITYSIQHQLLSKYYGSPSHPCGSSSGTYLTPFSIGDLSIKSSGYAFLSHLSREHINPSLAGFFYPPLNTGHYLSQFNSRLATTFVALNYDPCSATYYETLDYYAYDRYAEGLGLTRHRTFSFFEGGYDLIAYIKGTETYGNWAPLVLSTEEELAKQLLQVYPNPFTSELTLQLPEATSETAEVSIYNLQGQRVHQQPLLPAQTTQKVQLPSLPAGLYLLQVQQGGRSYTTKVQRQ